MDNVVSYVYEKFGDNLLRSEKALGLTTTTITTTTTTRNNVGGHWGSVPGSKKPLVSQTECSKLDQI